MLDLVSLRSVEIVNVTMVDGKMILLISLILQIGPVLAVHKVQAQLKAPGFSLLSPVSTNLPKL